MKTLRLYPDTSVFGGSYDHEFAGPSRRLFELVSEGVFILTISSLTVDELLNAPEFVRQSLDALSPASVESFEITEEMERLRDAYIRAGVLGKSSEADALHVAAASVANVDMIVSWNFRHIVRYDKIRGFNAVNLLNGYKRVDIYSPLEIVEI
ncbi:MAG: PIN domain-containing protein [Phycisphaeraceae bacterium]|nr:MAG: PIN domain-containing protein [Phycisphaeraceae bacterium]